MTKATIPTENRPFSTVALTGSLLNHHFRSDSINNMDHMRISGTEPSSVIFSQTKSTENVLAFMYMPIS